MGEFSPFTTGYCVIPETNSKFRPWKWMDLPDVCFICEFWCLWKIFISSRCRCESRYNHQNIWVGYRCILSWTIIISVSFFYSNSKYTVILENCSMVHLTFENMEMKIRKVESADVSPPPWLRLWIKENVLLKNPTKSGIKAEAVDPSWRPVVVGVLAFSRYKSWKAWQVGCDLDMYFVFFKSWYTYINQIHRIAMYNNCCTAVHVV